MWDEKEKRFNCDAVIKIEIGKYSNIRERNTQEFWKKLILSKTKLVVMEHNLLIVFWIYDYDSDSCESSDRPVLVRKH